MVLRSAKTPPHNGQGCGGDPSAAVATPAPARGDARPLAGLFPADRGPARSASGFDP